MIDRHRKRLAWSIALGLAAAAAGAVLYMAGAGSPGGRVATLLPYKVAPTVLGWRVRSTVLAGDGHAGHADGSAGTARFADPYGLALDRAGNLYVADGGDNNRIRKLAPDGSVSTLAGGREGFADGAGAAAAFNTPSGIAIDRGGNLIVADTGNNAIRKVTPQGMVSTLAGGGAPGYRDGVGAAARFNGPLGVALDAHGNVLVADTYNDRIRRIAPDGSVSTLAGGAPGNQDGPAAQARFDTPAALVVDSLGAVLVADSANGSIRRLGPDGMVSTYASAGENGGKVQLRRPVALSATPDGYLYVADLARGRIWQVAPGGVVRGLHGAGIDIAVGDARTPRLARPTGLALERDGSLVVADALGKVVRRLAPASLRPAAVPALTAAQPVAAPAVAGVEPANASAPGSVEPATASALGSAADFPWPVAPQHAWHEIVGIVGECRGSYDGESRDHFHNGLDVQAAMGTPVLAVKAEKVASPAASWGFGEIAEGVGVDDMAYVHMRVGRNVRDVPLDDARFLFEADEKGKLRRVRVKRGTRFQVGDQLGTVNRMFHVHLVQHVAGADANPIALPFMGLVDRIAPRIDSVFLSGADGLPLGVKGARRVLVPANAGPLALVVEAYDQIDGDAARRKLGLYKLGYQILHADGSALPGYEQPRVTIEFNRLPPDPESVKLAYAANSGITVYGSARTRFLYEVTNTVRDGRAEAGSIDPARLAPGDYLIRVLAADYAGNTASAKRDLAITVR